MTHQWLKTAVPLLLALIWPWSFASAQDLTVPVKNCIAFPHPNYGYAKNNCEFTVAFVSCSTFTGQPCRLNTPSLRPVTLGPGQQQMLYFAPTKYNRVFACRAPSSPVGMNNPEGGVEWHCDESGRTGAPSPPPPPAFSIPSPTGELPIQASFNCRMARSREDRLICSTREAANSDVEMTAAFWQASRASRDPNGLRQEQRQWIAMVRNTCVDAACMVQANRSRTAVLQGRR